MATTAQFCHAITLATVLLIVACDSSVTSPSDELGRGASLAAQTAEAADIFLNNADLEESAAWFFNAPTGMSVAYADGAGVDNSRGVRLTGDGTSGEGRFGFMGQSVAVGDLSGRKLTLTARIRLVNVQGAGMSIALRGDNPATPVGSAAELFATTQDRIRITGNADWATYRIELDGFNRNITSVVAFVVLLPGTTGSVSVDNITLSFGAASVSPTELANGDFETGSDTPEHWWWGGASTSKFAFAWAATGGHTGSRAVSISRPVASAQDFAFWAQTINPTAFLGGPVTLRVRVRPELVGPGVSLVVRGDSTRRPSGFADAFATSQGVTTISGSSGWAERTVTLSRLPTGMQSLTVYLVYLPGTSGTVHLDAVTLTP